LKELLYRHNREKVDKPKRELRSPFLLTMQQYKTKQEATGKILGLTII
jgi:hypothetical protein